VRPGTHHLSAGVVELLHARREAQAAERLACREAWPTHTYEGQTVSLVFTNARGGLVNRQAAAKAVTRAATQAGLDPQGIATHTGRRTAVTVLYAEAGSTSATSPDTSATRARRQQLRAIVG
jgi:hypothetical protein